MSALAGLWFAAANLGIVLIIWQILPWRRTQMQVSVAVRAAVLLGALATAYYIPVVGLTFWAPSFYLGYDVPAFEAVAAMGARGAPIYPVAEQGSYGLLYGPMAYLPYSLALKFVPSLWTPKIVALLLACASGAVLLVLAGGRRVSARMLAGGGAFMVVMAPALPTLLVPKGDLIVLLCAALPWMARRERWFSIAAAAAAAIAVNTKITALAMFLPHLFWWLAVRVDRRLKSALTGLGVFILIMIAPFALPEVSLEAYLGYLRDAGAHPWLLRLIGINALLLIPLIFVLALFGFVLPKNSLAQPLFAGLILAYLLTLPAACKAGSSIYQFWGLLPSLLIFITTIEEGHAAAPTPQRGVSARWLVALGVITVTCFARGGQDYALWWNSARSAKAEQGDLLRAVESARPVALLGGARDGAFDYALDSKVFEAALAGALLPTTSVAMSERWAANQPVPREIEEGFSRCEIPLFISLRGQIPWTQRSLYAQVMPEKASLGTDRGLVYGTSLRGAFELHYEIVERQGAFEFWRCHDAPSMTSERDK